MLAPLVTISILMKASLYNSLTVCCSGKTSLFTYSAIVDYVTASCIYLDVVGSVILVGENGVEASLQKAAIFVTNIFEPSNVAITM